MEFLTEFFKQFFEGFWNDAWRPALLICFVLVGIMWLTRDGE